ncbi:DNA-3-methyladenine glycosylase I [Mobilicoccus caccae]|uniref:DNA-3-methyladenine glycosylase I n=1 Tax=Mobilicoccus caccae TaxID=1859295 RepID=A0ABQ6IU79_9MICO|nr:DNA-3-methyladenine glycosylase I [Mobilicoccus caccae]GMA41499.1 hypothetical protein GCM10025883_35440 [Mobilicoccus caccae]
MLAPDPAVDPALDRAETDPTDSTDSTDTDFAETDPTDTDLAETDPAETEAGPDLAPTVLSSDGVLRPAWADRGEAVRRYYDTEWGRPVESEAGLFELIALLVFAGGLTWSSVLGRRDALREAFAAYDASIVAAFTDADVDRLVADASMIRNRRKIEAVVTDARAVMALRDHGGLVDLVWGRSAGELVAPAVDVSEIPRAGERSARLAADLKEAGFVHLGPVMAQALLLAAGIVPVRRAVAQPSAVDPAGGTDRRTVDF